MSCENTNARLQIKYTTLTGQVPSIPSTNDHNDGTWNPTDIYIGEYFLNAYDDLLWVRTLNGILPISGTGGTGSFIGDFVSKANGGSYSNAVFAPTFSAFGMTSTTISATSIDANIFGSTGSVYYGDGSNLTGVLTEWNGGTVSNPSYFNNTVDFTQDISVNNIYNGDLGYMHIHSDIILDGGLSASYFIGDGSLLTNLPMGPTANDYTTSSYLDGNVIRFDRTDLVDAYSVDLTPILLTQSVAGFQWDQATNAATIFINDGSLFTIYLNSFNDISANIINATDVYATNFYGTFNGTQSGPSTNAIISTTYNDLIISASNSTLLPGNWYNFQYTLSGDPGDPFPIDIDYNIFLLAMTNNTVDLTSGKRVMSTPIYTDSVVEDWYSTVNYSVDDRVIFCNRVWRNIDTGAGNIEGDYNLDTVTWELEISLAYYKDIVYDISYNLVNQEVTHQRDSHGNEIYGEGQDFGDLLYPQNTIDISDWHNSISIGFNNIPFRSNNFCKGMWNNVCNDLTTPTTILANNVVGFIYGNKCTNIEDNNIFDGSIRDNDLNNAEIANNRAKYIQDNTNIGSFAIFDNNISGFIRNNQISGNITANYNLGDINNNISGAIYNNNNNSHISYNEIVGSIFNNSNAGNISQNTSGTDGSIYLNTNGDNISYNLVDGYIGFNSNAGYISDNTTPGNINNNTGIGNIDSNNIPDHIEYNNTNDIVNNTCTEMISHNTGGFITNNSNTGKIKNNVITNQIFGNDSNVNDIQWNVSSNIDSNTNSGGIILNKVNIISSNSNTGTISGNIGGDINNNSNVGAIDLNEVVAGISTNTNNGYITANQAQEIVSNANNCNIYENDVEGSISSNNVNADINNNKATDISNNSVTSGGIYYNVIKGNISSNGGSGPINSNLCYGISSNSKSYISRNTLGGIIESNNVAFITGNNGCQDGIYSNVMPSGSIIDNFIGKEIYGNSITGDILRNDIRFKISNNSNNTINIQDNTSFSIEDN